MAGTVKFDCSAGQAYLATSLAASTGYTITFQAFLTPAALVAFQTDPNCSLLAIPAAGNIDGIYIQSGTPNFSSYFGSPGGSIALSAWMTIECDLTLTSGTSRDTTFTANGTVFSDGVQDYGITSASVFPINLGPIFCTAASPGAVVYIRNFVAKNASNVTIKSDDFTGTLGGWTVTGSASIADDPAADFPTVTTPNGVCVAFGADALDATPTWVNIDTAVQRWSIRRGRSYSTDRTQTGTAQADFVETRGRLDPTNSTGPFYPMNPNCPFAIGITNPVTSASTALFTGMVQQVPQTVDTSAKFSQGSIMADDLFSLLAISEIPPGLDFDNTGTGSSTPNTIGDTTYASQTVQERIEAVLADAGIPSALTNIFTGNVQVQACTEPPGTTALEMIWNAADAEFPGVANVFPSKDGIVSFRGRLARFDPTNPLYDIDTWNVGDVPAVALDSTKALVSKITFDRDVAKIVNASRFSPDLIADADIPGQLSTDTGSITQYGNRTYSGDNLLTAGDLSGPNAGDPLASTKEFSDYWTDNFHNAQTRVYQLEFRWVPITAANATAHWAFLCGVELSDVVNVTTTHPGGGGFNAEPYFVEGITYVVTNQAGSSTLRDITLTLDLSPAAYFSQNPFPS